MAAGEVVAGALPGSVSGQQRFCQLGCWVSGLLPAGAPGSAAIVPGRGMAVPEHQGTVTADAVSRPRAGTVPTGRGWPCWIWL